VQCPLTSDLPNEFATWTEEDQSNYLSSVNRFHSPEVVEQMARFSMLPGELCVQGKLTKRPVNWPATITCEIPSRIKEANWFEYFLKVIKPPLTSRRDFFDQYKKFPVWSYQPQSRKPFEVVDISTKSSKQHQCDF
jgi:hypothetical protein